MTQTLSKPEKEPTQTSLSASNISTPLEVEGPIKHLFTVEQFESILEKGILEPEKHYELIYGVILEMPGNPPHRHAVTRLTGLLLRALPNDVEVSTQNYIDLSLSDTRPEPDLMVIPLEKYDEDTYAPQDAAFVIEISDSTLRYDQRTKLSLYAQAGVREYWILNIPSRSLEQYRNPLGDGFKSKTTLLEGELASCLAYPDLALEWWRALKTQTAPENPNESETSSSVPENSEKGVED